MYTPSRSVERWQTPIVLSSTPTRLSDGPVYHVYSHYGCRSKDIDRCDMCKYLVQPNTYLHSNSQSLVAATKHRRILPPIRPKLLPTPVKPIRHRINDRNDLYLLPKIYGSSQTLREAEDAAIINICSKDKSIDRIILVDAEEESNLEKNEDVRYVRLYDLEKRLY